MILTITTLISQVIHNYTRSDTVGLNVHILLLVTGLVVFLLLAIKLLYSTTYD